MTTKKILIIIDAFSRGGAQIVLLNLIEVWLDLDLNVELILIQNSKNELDLENYLNRGLVIHRIDAKNMYDLSKFLYFKKIVNSSHADRIYANLFWSQIWSGIVNWSARKNNLIWIEHNTYFNRTRAQWFFYTALSSRIRNIIAVSNEVNNFLKKKVKVQVKVIFNPVRFLTSQKLRNFKRPKFLFVGRLNSQKNPMLALESFSLALKNNIIPNNSIFNIAGEGPMAEEIANYIKQEGLDKSVNVLGFIDIDLLSELYSTSHTLLSTSKFEGFSLARVEAITFGCAIVTTKTSGVQGVLSENNNYKTLIPGVFIVEEDIGEVACALGESISQKFWTKSIVLKRMKISENFDLSTIARKYLAM